MTTFETGATTSGANNLVLSVMNDGQAYDDRKHAGFAMLQGANHRLSFRDIVANEANKQRQAFKLKFKPQEITQAAAIVKALTIEQCIEQIRDTWTGERIACYGRKWFDATNGNTYFSCRIVIPCENGARWISLPFQYGYGDQWGWECRHVLDRMGFEGMASGYGSEKPIKFTFEGKMLKRDMYNRESIKGLDY